MIEELKLAYWQLRGKWAEWRLFRQIGSGDAKKGERIFRKALAQVTLEEVLAHMEQKPVCNCNPPCRLQQLAAMSRSELLDAAVEAEHEVSMLEAYVEDLEKDVDELGAPW